MLIAVVEDLLFSSKIRNVAKQAGVEVAFVRDPDAIVDTVRTRRPAIVVFDLNATRLQPIEAIARLRSDPELAGVRTVGFASHVHTALIDAARSAGTHDVMPRSAFVTALPDIVSSAR